MTTTQGYHTESGEVVSSSPGTSQRRQSGLKPQTWTVSLWHKSAIKVGFSLCAEGKKKKTPPLPFQAASVYWQTFAFLILSTWSPASASTSASPVFSLYGTVLPSHKASTLLKKVPPNDIFLSDYSKSPRHNLFKKGHRYRGLGF